MTNNQATRKHIVSRSAPAVYRVPEGIPTMPKFHTILADPPWCKNQQGRGRYGGAIQHYDLMSLDRIKQMPVAELAADNAHLYLWITNGNLGEGLEVMKAWGFHPVNIITWIKLRMGMGNYFRNATENCLFGVRGQMPPLARNVINWIVANPTAHSEKPREFISGKVEKVSKGPYLELFCRKRPASREQWYCWGDETEGGADIFIPGYPVPKYSFEPDNAAGSKTEQGAPGSTEASQDNPSGQPNPTDNQPDMTADQPDPTNHNDTPAEEPTEEV